jgi:ABC-type transport system involved in cytochrome bd biosynthesis fused ATPase/permease subunit
LKNADQLELNDIERFDTEVSIGTNRLMTIIPLISVLFAWLFRNHWSAGLIGGMTYFLLPIVMPMYGRRADKRRNKLIAAINARTERATEQITA